MKILILASQGKSLRATKGEYPWFLTEYEGRPVLEKTIEKCLRLSEEGVVLTASVEDANRYALREVLGLISPGIKLVTISQPTQGAACSALMSIEDIDNSEELLILNANEFIDVDFSHYVKGFRKIGYDAAVLTFQSVHPRYSYVRLDKSGLVVEAAEKRPISRNATAGFYWFSQGSLFVQAAIKNIRDDQRVESLFYVCPTLNQLILSGGVVGAVEIPPGTFHPLKDDKQIASYEFLRGL